MLKLYHNDMSSCSQKVRLCLAEKELEWEDGHLDLRAGEQQQAWYVKLNPRGVVPTLVDDETVVPESNVINEYVDERFPDPPLMPKSPRGRAAVRLWTKQLDEGIHDAGISVLSFSLAFHQQYLERGEQGRAVIENGFNSAKRERRRDILEKGLDSPFVAAAISRMEELLIDMETALSAHQWLADDTYTIADAAFTPYVLRLDHLNILGMLDARPLVSAWYERCRERPSFVIAIRRWENARYLSLMKDAGTEHWSKIQSLMKNH